MEKGKGLKALRMMYGRAVRKKQFVLIIPLDSQRRPRKALPGCLALDACTIPVHNLEWDHIRQVQALVQATVFGRIFSIVVLRAGLPCLPIQPSPGN